MITAPGPISALTASELMTRDVIRIPETMPLREAARLLLQERISGAPVVDEADRCVGVFSAMDFLRMGLNRKTTAQPTAPPLPLSCAFQERRTTPEGREVVHCTLPPGVCPIQTHQEAPGGEDLLVCGQPHCVLADWQVVEVEDLPTDGVSNYMTRDPVLVDPETTIQDLAKRMIDAHIHRVIVVNAARVPLGVVSSTDLLATLANLRPPE